MLRPHSARRALDTAEPYAPYHPPNGSLGLTHGTFGHAHGTFGHARLQAEVRTLLVEVSASRLRRGQAPDPRIARSGPRWRAPVSRRVEHSRCA